MDLTQNQVAELRWICAHPFGLPVDGGFVDNRSAMALERRGLLTRVIVGNELRWRATAEGKAEATRQEELRDA